MHTRSHVSAVPAAIVDDPEDMFAIYISNDPVALLFIDGMDIVVTEVPFLVK